ncbi:polymeric immunoglobulin receptor-like isoform X14 [Dicentrarchus labrax]|uniref:polymeric immunoglobulin receptor-like isoform X14 n=1 Tax=Dicentrarchus labrax TaxID=13489 RepID=UPI0021F53F49|nr:polymeric immunoglobulin receptor-like isoform X14 [Dicentrarchus labrax]
MFLLEFLFLCKRMRMWSLVNLLVTLCISLSCVSSAAELNHLFGYEGRDVNVACPYGEGYESYEKYLCRNACGSDDVLITTSGAAKNKYSIHDDQKKRVFTATISDLKFMDAGKYWCGVTKTGYDIYPAEVKVEVKQDTCCDRSTKVQGYETGSVSLSCPYESEYLNNIKYICRGNQPSTCLQQALITSDHKRNRQFTLTDDTASRKFTVTITGVTQRDSGSYLCGVHRNTGLDVFSAVELEVNEWCCVKTSKLSGIVGHPVTMQCPYPPQHKNNRKFLCKGDHHISCTDMVTSQTRFTLQDDVSSSSFLVMITELKAGDAGTYWCGSDSQWTTANYTKIHLSVDTPQTNSVTSTITVEESARSPSMHIPGKDVMDATLFHSVVFIVPAVLLILVIALVVVYKYKCHKVRGDEAVIMNRNKTKAAEAEDVIDLPDIYENQEVVVRSEHGTSKAQKICDDVGEDEQDSVYQNFSTTDDIYCNQIYIKAKR